MCIVKRGKRRAESGRSGGGVVDNLRGGQGNDVLFAGSGATVGTTSIVFGGTGDDKINGGVDADDLRGGRGIDTCLLYTSPSPRDQRGSRMPSSA